MLDFTSSLYLGFRHPHRRLPAWERLTTGSPAAIVEPTASKWVAAELAELTGSEAAVLGASTLHLFTDLAIAVRDWACSLYVDRELYPIAALAMGNLAGRRSGVVRFEHQSPDHLVAKLDETARPGVRPVVLTDGVCTRSGRVAPVDAYLDIVTPRSGLVVVDDTQGLGVLGHDPTPTMPYGRGGGGSLEYLNTMAEKVVVISSLAKGFGVPVAVATGSRAIIDLLKRRSFTRVSCSPPSAAHLYAAGAALRLNRKLGDSLRLRLLDNVCALHQVLGAKGLRVSGGVFPVQTVYGSQSCEPLSLYRELRRLGVGTVLCSERDSKKPTLSFVVTARHDRRDIHDLEERLDTALRICSGRDKHIHRRTNSEASYA